jgi:hypothetical protein
MKEQRVMSLEARTRALLDLVAADRRAQCESIVGAARSAAEAQLAQARSEARLRVRQAFAEQRQRAADALAAARADLQTRRRLHAQRRVEALLALAWQRLPAALRERWARPEARARWVAHALAAARNRLPGGAWTLQHAPDWPAGESEPLAAALQAELGVAPTLVPDARIAAGIRIVAGGNVVDATLAGLIADRDEIGGRLIGLLEKAP